MSGIISARRKVSPEDRVPPESALIDRCEECDGEGWIVHPGGQSVTLTRCTHYRLIAELVTIMEGGPRRRSIGPAEAHEITEALHSLQRKGIA